MSRRHPEVVYTVGHSNRSLAQLFDILAPWRIETLVDVRRKPWSRRHPHFCKPQLASAVQAESMRYVHAEALGGMRDPSPDSPNTGLDETFRGYADHLVTGVFKQALVDALTHPQPIILMCAEASPANCHRAILSDELVRRGLRVIHILDLDRHSIHRLDPRAVDDGSRLIYPSRSESQMSLPL